MVLKAIKAHADSREQREKLEKRDQKASVVQLVTKEELEKMV